MDNISNIEKHQILKKTKQIIEKVLIEKNATEKNIGINIPIGVYDIDSMDTVGIAEDIEQVFNVRLSLDDVAGDKSVSNMADSIIRQMIGSV